MKMRLVRDMLRAARYAASSDAWQDYPLGDISADSLTGGSDWDGSGSLPGPVKAITGIEDWQSYSTGNLEDTALTGGTGWDGGTTIIDHP